MDERASRFRRGDRVRVRAEEPRRHHRTPGYVKGKVGEVLRVRGAFRDPESLAYGGDGLPQRALYLVCFAAAALWPRYEGAETDHVYADLYEHWLDPASADPAPTADPALTRLPSSSSTNMRSPSSGQARGSLGEAP